MINDGEKMPMSRILLTKQYLETQTDEAHPATIADILAHMESVGIPASRKAIQSDLEQLTETGYDIVRNTGRQHEYFVGDRHFELPELKLLVDAVQAAKFVSARKSASLTQKLTVLTSVHLAGELNRQTYIESRIKPDNEKVYLAVDVLHSAIQDRHKVQFKYYEYDRYKRKQYKHDRQLYTLSPYGMLWNHDSYYVVGHSDSHGKVITFRVDRIATPEATDLPAEPPPSDFDISVYARAVFSMYDGPMQTVTLKCKNEIMKTIIDRFGEGVETDLPDNDHFTATVTVSTSLTFYGWVFSFGGKMTILAPEQAVREYTDLLRAQIPR